jgi:hypothetical protein
MDFKKVPKQFCENISAGFTEDFFAMALHSGEAAATYALTPEHMKRLAQYLAHQVKEYEKAHGAINAEWNPNIKSPIQSTEAGSDEKS